MRHYENGEQIVTGEPCLNCTCRDSMHMCFLKVCPYVRPLSKGCTAEKLPGQCCPTVTCDQGERTAPGRARRRLCSGSAGLPGASDHIEGNPMPLLSVVGGIR